MGDLPSTGSLQLEVAFDRKEHSAAQVAAMRRGPLLRRPVVLLPTIAVAGLLLGLLPNLLHHVIHLALPLAARTAVGILGMVVIAFGIKRIARQREEAERHEAHADVYTLNDAGLEISGKEDLALMSWSSMTRVHETDRFFLFVSGSEVQYLPKRVLRPDQLEFVRALTARHGPASGRPRLGS